MNYSFLLLTISAFFFSNVLFSQNPFSENYQGISDGNHKQYYNNGKVRILVNLENGKLQGKHISYFKNGKINEIIYFDKGYFHGTTIMFNKKGDTLQYEIYKHDSLKFSEFRTFYRNNQLKFSETYNFSDSSESNPFYKSDKQSTNRYMSYDFNKFSKEVYNEDVFKKYYRNGNLKYETLAIKGVYEGLYQEFFKNGNVKIKAHHKDNKYNEEFIQYYKNGKIKIKSFCKDGKWHGKYTHYNKKGTVKKQKNYTNGKTNS